MKLKGYRTLVWNVLNGVAMGMTITMESLSSAGWALPEWALPIWVVALTTSNIGLRLVTTTPVGER